MATTDKVGDSWCPNCKQYVKGKDDLGGPGCLIIIAIWIGGAALLYWLGYTESWAGKIALIVGLVVAGAVGASTTTQSCPMCGTENLSTESDKP